RLGKDGRALPDHAEGEIAVAEGVDEADSARVMAPLDGIADLGKGLFERAARPEQTEHADALITDADVGSSARRDAQLGRASRLPSGSAHQAGDLPVLNQPRANYVTTHSENARRLQLVVPR